MINSSVPLTLAPTFLRTLNLKIRLIVLCLAALILGCSDSEPELITDPKELAAYLKENPSPEMPEPSPDDFVSP